MMTTDNKLTTTQYLKKTTVHTQLHTAFLKKITVSLHVVVFISILLFYFGWLHFFLMCNSFVCHLVLVMSDPSVRCCVTAK